MLKSKITKDWPLIGNSHIFEYLNKAIGGYKKESSQNSGTFIFAGCNDLGKNTTAYFFAKSLLCEQSDDLGYCGECGSCRQFSAMEKAKNFAGNIGENAHNDLFVLEKNTDKKNISIEQIRDLIKSLSLTSFLGSCKVAIIKDAEALSEEAANSLLKTLEEPNSKVVIILITTDPDHLPATIVSRSQILRFYPVPSDLIHDHLVERYKAPRSAAKNFSRLSLGRPALAVKFFENKDFFNNYAALAAAIVGLKKQGINDRFSVIESWLKDISGQELADSAGKIIRLWQSVARDMILLHYGLDDLIQHEFLSMDIKQAKTKYRLVDMREAVKRLQEADKLVRSNVNAKTVLENVAINI